MLLQGSLKTLLDSSTLKYCMLLNFRANLGVIPNTLNPRLKTLIFQHDNLPIVHFSLT